VGADLEEDHALACKAHVAPQSLEALRQRRRKITGSDALSTDRTDRGTAS